MIAIICSNCKRQDHLGSATSYDLRGRCKTCQAEEARLNKSAEEMVMGKK